MENFKRLSASLFRSSQRPLLLAAACGALLCALGCGPLGLGPATSASANKGASQSLINNVTEDADEIALKLDGRSVTVGEIDEYMKDSFLEDLLRQPASSIYEAREKASHTYVQRTIIDAEAKKAGLTNEELFKKIVSSAAQPTASEVSDWFTANQSKLRGAKLEDVSSRIEELILNERRGEAWNAFIGPKIEALDYQLVIEPPRAELPITRLLRGDSEAPITLTAFSDYQCPYCVRAEPTLAEVLSRFPGKVKLVHRHFPLDSIHPFARPAAEATMCADEQGKFWEFHDAVFARNGKLSEAAFTEIAGELSLDGSAFSACIAENRYAEFVQKDLETGERAGVTGTPALFVNGILLKGARSADEISKVVESELARMK